jgi:hypothetical protein
VAICGFNKYLQLIEEKKDDRRKETGRLEKERKKGERERGKSWPNLLFQAPLMYFSDKK